MEKSRRLKPLESVSPGGVVLSRVESPKLILM
jgi:hypothetical protein